MRVFNRASAALAGLVAPALFASVFAAQPAAAGCQGSQCFEQVVTPPVYRTEHHEVLVEPERRLAHRVAPQFASVEETVTLRGPRQVVHHVPAEYSSVEERVLLAPGGRHWQVSIDAYGRTIGCWVEVPPHYGVRQRTVEVRPAQTYYETIPAVTGTRIVTVMTRPSAIEVETIPARYETVAQEVEVQPASVGWRPIGGGYRYTPRRHCGSWGGCRR